MKDIIWSARAERDFTNQIAYLEKQASKKLSLNI
jgi:plasmid stabilization system protein ParE